MKRNTNPLDQLAQGAGINFVLGILGSIMFLFFTLIAARYYGPERFGLFIMAKTLLGVGGIIVTLGIPRSILKFIPHYMSIGDNKSLSGFVRFIYIFPLISSVVIGGSTYLFAPQITAFFEFPLIFTNLLRIVALILPIQALTDITRNVLYAEKQILYGAIGRELIEKTALILGILFIISFKLDLQALVVLLGISLTLSLAYNSMVHFSIIKLDLSKDIRYRFGEWLNLSLPLLFTGFLVFFIRWTDNFVIAKFLDATELGIYSAAFTFPMFLGVFRRSFALIFVPLVSESYAKKNSGEIELLFKKSAGWLFGITFPLFLVVTVHSKRILSLLFGESYSAGSTALIIIAVGVMINFSSGLGDQVLLVNKKTKFIFWVNSLIFSYNLAMNLILVPRFGINGAAISTGSSIALQHLIFLLLAKKYQKLQFDYIYNLKFIVAGIFAILVSTLALLFNFEEVMAILVVAILYVGTYIAVLRALKTFTKEDQAVIKTLEQRLRVNMDFIKKLLRMFRCC